MRKDYSEGRKSSVWIPICKEEEWRSKQPATHILLSPDFNWVFISKWEVAGCPLNTCALLFLHWRGKRVMAHHVGWMIGLPLKENKAVHMLLTEPPARHHSVCLTLQYIPCSFLWGESSLPAILLSHSFTLKSFQNLFQEIKYGRFWIHWVESGEYLPFSCVCVCVNHTTVASGFHSVDLLLNMAILCDKLAEWNHLPEKVSFHWP